MVPIKGEIGMKLVLRIRHVTDDLYDVWLEGTGTYSERLCSARPRLEAYEFADAVKRAEIVGHERGKG